MSDGQQPVGDGHIAFARALVALAREHGVGLLDATFTRDGSRTFRRGEWDPTRVTLAWREGRPGIDSTISLRAEAQIVVAETVMEGGDA